MTTVSARETSRGFSALLDRVEQDGEEYTLAELRHGVDASA